MDLSGAMTYKSQHLFSQLMTIIIQKVSISMEEITVQAVY